MSNSYYVFSPRFIPGTKVRAQAVNNQFDLLEDAFDLLPTTPASIPLGKSTLGVESGSGNAYVVTMPNTRLANANGDEVVFKATHQNSGASTLQVDSIAAVSLVRWDGTALSSGDILVDSYYVARYDSTNTRFMIVAPAQSTVVGAITYAAPTGKAKLAASAGTLATLIRSDADIAIDQTIVPTWSGQHTFSSPTLGPAGTALLPAWSFSGDPNTGAYSVGTDDWGVSTGGTLRFDISTTAVTSTLPLLANAGSATAPAHSFSGDPNTGAYSVGADDWGVTTGGTLRFDISTTAVTSTLPHLNANGSATAPAFSFSGDPNTGSYNVGADDWGVSTGGTLRFDISTTAVTSTLPLLANAGSATAPAHSFSGDSNTGAYNVGADDWGVTTGGALRFDISTTAVTSTLVLLGPNGSATAPTWSFSGDSNTGVYSAAADAIGFTAGGTARAVVTTQGIGPNQDGSAGSPAIFFNTDTNTGIFRRATDTIAFVAGGAQAFEVQNSGSIVSIFAEDGTTARPIYSFANDPNTGLYRTGTDSLALSCGGQNMLVLTDPALANSVVIGASSTTALALNAATSGSASGGAATLPANPVSFLSVSINGTNRKIPFYAT